MVDAVQNTEAPDAQLAIVQDGHGAESQDCTDGVPKRDTMPLNVVVNHLREARKSQPKSIENTDSDTDTSSEDTSHILDILVSSEELKVTKLPKEESSNTEKY